MDREWILNSFRNYFGKRESLLYRQAIATALVAESGVFEGDLNDVIVEIDARCKCVRMHWDWDPPEDGDYTKAITMTLGELLVVIETIEATEHYKSRLG